jgi:hypothetical protein
LWSYGDSNPGPLACHQQAARPPQYVCAGHRPRKCAPVPSSPHRLRYFPAVPASLPNQAPNERLTSQNLQELYRGALQGDQHPIAPDECRKAPEAAPAPATTTASPPRPPARDPNDQPPPSSPVARVRQATAERPDLVDMQVVVRLQDQGHCASITCMIRHYVARRAQVTEGHPHNADVSTRASLRGQPERRAASHGMPSPRIRALRCQCRAGRGRRPTHPAG